MRKGERETGNGEQGSKSLKIRYEERGTGTGGGNGEHGERSGKRGRMNEKSSNTEQGKIGNDEGGTSKCNRIS